MKNILHIIDSLGRGGSEKLLVSYVNELVNYRNYVVYLNKPDDLKNEFINSEIILVHKKNNFSIINNIRSLRQIVKDKKIDIIHSHGYWPNIISRFIVKRKTKIFNHYHFSDYETKRNTLTTRIMIYLDIATYKSQFVRIYVSDYIKKVITESCGINEKDTVLKNFTDTFSKIDLKYIPWHLHQRLKLIAVGSNKPEKNYVFLIEAFKLLREKNVEIKIYGGGNSLENLQISIKDNKLTNIHFMGETDEVDLKLIESNAFVSCSIAEACPLSPIEAWASKLPLILSNIPALKEIAGDNALYFDPFEVNSFVNMINDILEGKIKIVYNEAAVNKFFEFNSKSNYMANLIKKYEDI
jgi:glycosyltransferase involved in cell wall biosynthesis